MKYRINLITGLLLSVSVSIMAMNQPDIEKIILITSDNKKVNISRQALPLLGYVHNIIESPISTEQLEHEQKITVPTTSDILKKIVAISERVIKLSPRYDNKYRDKEVWPIIQQELDVPDSVFIFMENKHAYPIDFMVKTLQTADYFLLPESIINGIARIVVCRNPKKVRQMLKRNINIPKNVYPLLEKHLILSQYDYEEQNIADLIDDYLVKQKDVKKIITQKTLYKQNDGTYELRLRCKNLTSLDGIKKMMDIIGDRVTQITKINFAHNELTCLSKNIGQFIHLKNLILKNNNLTSMPKEIKNLTNLQDLDLAANKINKFPKNICALINLKTINLAHNEIPSEKFPDEIKNLTNLQNLDLKWNGLKKFPQNIVMIVSLKNLDLYGNYITSIPKKIDNLTNLQNLRLNDNTALSDHHLTHLPENIGTLKNLEIFAIRGSNKLTKLPKTFWNLDKLYHLTIDKSNITSIPEDIGNLFNLKYLRFEDSNITNLPEKMKKLTNLTTLELDNNKFTFFPPVITKLKKIEYLSLADNKITEIHKNIGALKKLKKLFLAKNKLTTLPNQMKKLTDLTTFDLSHNSCVDFPNIIGKLTSLKVLIMGYNKLKSIPPIIGNLKQLRGLDISGNNLSSLPKELKKLNNLKVLQVVCENKLDNLSFINKHCTQLELLECYEDKYRIGNNAGCIYEEVFNDY